MNPYRASEYAVAVACVVLVLAVIAVFMWLITVTESWKGVGIIAVIIVSFCGLGILQAEWWKIESWWCRKRSEWDAKRRHS